MQDNTFPNKSCCSVCALNICIIPSPVDGEDVVEESDRTIDHIAVLTSNALFFIVMFIFAVFET